MKKLFTFTAVFCIIAMIVTLAIGCSTTEAKPAIDSLSPTSGAAGTQVEIKGSNFGKTQGIGTVHFGSKLAEVDAWSETSITVKVPSGLTATEYGVTVEAEAGASNEVQFDVTDGGQDQADKNTPVEAIEKYCQEQGINISGWDFDVAVVSSSDPNWKIDYGFPPEAEGEGIFFLLNLKNNEWTVIAHTEDAGWTADELKALGAPTDLVLGPSPDDIRQAQENAVEDYAKTKGIVIGEQTGGIVYKGSKDSSIDDTWSLLTYQAYEGMALTYFLLHEAAQGQSWDVVADGGDDFNPQAYGAPSDLTL